MKMLMKKEEEKKLSDILLLFTSLKIHIYTNSQHYKINYFYLILPGSVIYSVFVKYLRVTLKWQPKDQPLLS